jgi:trimeric autotransporter adhesin
MRLPRAVLPLAMLVVLPAAGCGGPSTSPSGQPAILSQLSLAPAAVPAGATSEATVTLTGRAPAGGTAVRISSSDGVATAPATVTVAEGAISTTFTVKTKLVGADTVATISAAAGGAMVEAVLRVMTPVAGPPTLQSLDIDRAALKGGETTMGTVRLTGAAPIGGTVIQVRSSNPAAVVPATVTVPVGALSATFTVSTRTVSLETELEITAFFSDQTRTVPIRLAP